MTYRTTHLAIVFALVGLMTLPRTMATAQFPTNEWNRPFKPFQIIGNLYYGY